MSGTSPVRECGLIFSRRASSLASSDPAQTDSDHGEQLATERVLAIPFLLDRNIEAFQMHNGAVASNPWEPSAKFLDQAFCRLAVEGGFLNLQNLEIRSLVKREAEPHQGEWSEKRVPADSQDLFRL